ncbi:hypothetical protein [Pseudomonas sp.]|uniref:hypothetical protein n=1 Tax=Pseudomonas sp. TaxID=306 RepID=UPI003C72A35F
MSQRIVFNRRLLLTQSLARNLAATAVPRRRQGGNAQVERQLLRDNGLLNPLDYKVRDLGHWLLNGKAPRPRCMADTAKH